MTRHRFLVRSIVWGVLIWAPIASVLSCAMTILLPAVFLVGRGETETHPVWNRTGQEVSLPVVFHRSWCFVEVERTLAGSDQSLAAFIGHPNLEQWMVQGDQLATATPTYWYGGTWLIFGFGWPEPMMYVTVDRSSAIRGGKALSGGRAHDQRILPGQFNERGIAVSVPIHILLWAIPIAMFEICRYRLRLARHQCPRCRYLLAPRTLDAHGRAVIPGCPECGLGYESALRESDQTDRVVRSGGVSC